MSATEINTPITHKHQRFAMQRDQAAGYDAASVMPHRFLPIFMRM
jgi:hypothetical protein